MPPKVRKAWNDIKESLDQPSKTADLSPLKNFNDGFYDYEVVYSALNPSSAAKTNRDLVTGTQLQSTGMAYASCVGNRSCTIIVRQSAVQDKPIAHAVPVHEGHTIATIAVKHVNSLHPAVEIKHALIASFPGHHSTIYDYLVKELVALGKYLSFHPEELKHLENVYCLPAAEEGEDEEVRAYREEGPLNYPEDFVEGNVLLTFTRTALFLGRSLALLRDIGAGSGQTERNLQAVRRDAFFDHLRQAFVSMASAISFTNYETDLAAKFELDLVARQGIASAEIHPTLCLAYAQHCYFVEVYANLGLGERKPEESIFDDVPVRHLEAAGVRTPKSTPPANRRGRENGALLAAPVPPPNTAGTQAKKRPAPKAKAAHRPAANHAVADLFPGESKDAFNRFIKDELKLPFLLRPQVFGALKEAKLLPGFLPSKRFEAPGVVAYLKANQQALKIPDEVIANV